MPRANVEPFCTSSATDVGRRTSMSSSRLPWFLAAALVAGGCGSNDGPIFTPMDSGTDAPPPDPDGGIRVDSGPTDAGDLVAPFVVETTPADGAVDVAPGAAI